MHGRVLQRDGRTLIPMYRSAAALHNRRPLPTLFEDAWALKGCSEDGALAHWSVTMRRWIAIKSWS